MLQLISVTFKIDGNVFLFSVSLSHFMEQSIKLFGTHDWPSVGSSCDLRFLFPYAW
jgi:hypothetical protein